MVVGDHELGPGQSSVAQGLQKLGPEGTGCPGLLCRVKIAMRGNDYRVSILKDFRGGQDTHSRPGAMDLRTTGSGAKTSDRSRSKALTLQGGRSRTPNH